MSPGLPGHKPELYQQTTTLESLSHFRVGRVVQNKYEAIPLGKFYYPRKVDKVRSMSGWDDQEVIGKIILEVFLKR